MPTIAVLAAIVAALAVAACDRAGAPPVSSTRGSRPAFAVVAAENVWGSIAAQIAGSRARVDSIIANPSVDPHSYEPTVQDARTLADANMALVNGLGYDNWATELLRASPQRGRVVLDVGKQLALKEGANPHRWYFPADVRAVAAAIAADYAALDPADAAYFANRREIFERQGLAEYDRLRAAIRARYANVPVGYGESIFQGLGEDLRLRLRTPSGLAKAIAEGTDVSAGDRRSAEAQIRSRRIAIWIFNSQNLTPDVQRLNQAAAEEHIPAVAITETLSPPADSFQQWQSDQLRAILRALRAARAGSRAAAGKLRRAPRIER